MNLDADCFHIGCLERVARDRGQIQVQLIPTLGHANRHRDHERAQLRARMVTAHAHTPTNFFAVQNLFMGKN